MVVDSNPYDWRILIVAIIIGIGLLLLFFVAIPQGIASMKAQRDAEMNLDHTLIYSHCYIGCVNYVHFTEEDNATILNQCGNRCKEYADFWVYKNTTIFDDKPK